MTFLFKINQSGHFDGTAWRKRNNGSLNGIPDTLGITDGIPLACEVKKPGQKPSEEQRLFIKNWERMGGVAIVATSLEEFQTEFKKIKRPS